MISIVDDDPWARNGLRAFVESLGYSTLAFPSARHFLESRCIADTKCLITDLQMSGQTGLDLQQQLQAQGFCIPVIFVTAFPNEKHRERALSAGAVGFLTKPLNELALTDCLALAVNRGNRQDIGELRTAPFSKNR
jgi:FixJ family two-component response regulator